MFAGRRRTRCHAPAARRASLLNAGWTRRAGPSATPPGHMPASSGTLPWPARLASAETTIRRVKTAIPNEQSHPILTVFDWRPDIRLRCAQLARIVSTDVRGRSNEANNAGVTPE